MWRAVTVVALGLVVSCGKKAETSTTPQASESARSITKGIAKPIKTDVTGYSFIDRVDVGSEADETAHRYVIDKPTYTGTHQFDWPPGKAAYLEAGRATKTFETFRIKVAARRDHLLVRAFDTLAKDQKVKLSIDGVAAGEWALPNGGGNRYGEAAFPIPGAIIGDRTELTLRMDYVSGSPDVNAFVYWVFTKGSNGLPGPLNAELVGLTLADQLDVGDQNDEGAHQYVIDRPTFSGTHQFEGSGAKYMETGRATKSFETFRLKVAPGKDHVLLKAFDTLSKDQKVRLSVDGTAAGEWTLPNGNARYGEASFEIPKGLIGDKREITVRVDFVSGSIDTNSFYYWLYARSGAGKITRPLRTDVKALTLTDQVDVGSKEDEAKHEYAIDNQTFAGTHEFAVGGAGYVENGRATKSFETFKVKVRPGADHVLVKAFDTLSKDQKVRVVIDGKAVGDWSLPNGADRYGEASFKVPSRFIGEQNTVSVRLEYLAGSIDTNSFVVWMFAKSAPRAEQAP